VIGVSMDDEAASVVSTIDRLKLTYPVVMGDEHLGAAYGGVLGLPVTFLIDRHGRVQARYENADLVSMKRDLKRLLDSR
jgi:cytochrome c biogenesis protein CcmG, thiol:disulfide interchange protein DsbE